MGVVEAKALGLIMGETAIPTLQQLSSRLRKKTLERASELDLFNYPSYNPWLCIRPRRNAQLQNYPISTELYNQGDVLTNSDYLESVSNFLIQNRDLSLDHLPGNPEDWQILTDIEKDRPEMIGEFRELIRFVRDTSPFFDGIYSALVDFIVPMKQLKPQGLSNVYSRGAIFLSFAPGYEKMSLALDFVHEMGHQALFLFQSVDPLITNGWSRPVYSEIRHTDRPALLSLHAATAIAYMLKFCLDAGDPNYKHHDFIDPLSETLVRAINALKQDCEFTPMGSLILEEYMSLVN